MELRILGPLEVWAEGAEVSLGGPKPRLSARDAVGVSVWPSCTKQGTLLAMSLRPK